MSRARTFTLGAMTFEIHACTDPSTGTVNTWVYRTDIHPRATVATGAPDRLTLTPGYEHWDDHVAVLDQAVMDSIEGAT